MTEIAERGRGRSGAALTGIDRDRDRERDRDRQTDRHSQDLVGQEPKSLASEV